MAKQLKVSIILQSIADSAGFKAFNGEMNKAQAVLKRMAPTLNLVKSGFASMSVAGGLVGGAVAGAAVKSIEYASNIKDLSDQANVSTRALQALGFVALNNGANLDVMAKAMVQAQSAAADAASGNEAMAKKFERLGISAEAFAKLAPEQQMERMGRAINAASGEQEALAAAMDILGAKNAPKLMASLRELGEKGFVSVADSAAKAGQIMSAQTIAALDKAGDRIEMFKNRLTIAAGDFLSAFDNIEKAQSPVVKAAAELAETEALGAAATSSRALAHLKLAKALADEGKAQQALIEVKKADLGDNPTSNFQSLFLTGKEKALAAIKSARERDEADRKEREQRAATVLAADAKEAEQVKARAAAAEAAKAEEAKAKEENKTLSASIESFKDSESKKTKTVADEIQKRGELLSADANDYQRRGLQLGNARSQMALPSWALSPSRAPTVAPAPTFFSPNNAGREDVKIPRLLDSINQTLQGIARNGGSAFA